MASAAAKKLIEVSGLHEHLQGQDALYFLTLRLIDDSSASDSSADVMTEIFTNRLGTYRFQYAVRQMREWASQFQSKLGNLPPLVV